MGEAALATGLSALGLKVDPDVEEKLGRYLDLIVKWNAVHNLTAIRDRDRMVVEHVLDSLAIIPYVRPARILDIGSGAGLPGIPFALVRPEWRITLLDSNHKKCVFLRQVAIELSVNNVDVICERVEKVRRDLRFDTVVSRAFAETQHFAKVAVPLVADEGLILAMKGLYPYEELAQLPAEVVLKDVVAIQVPGLEARRHLVIMTKA